MLKSIIKFEAEEGFYHADLDLSYINGVGNDVAESLVNGHVAEVAYQPGDWTFYGLVFVPLPTMIAARSKEGSIERHAIRGVSMERNGDGLSEYRSDYALVCWVEHASYPFDLTEPLGISASYIASKLDMPMVSGASMALLLRSLSYHIARRTAPLPV